MLITISSVELPPDMRQAYVYVSTLNPEVEQGTGLAILNRNRKEWQSRIGGDWGSVHPAAHLPLRRRHRAGRPG